jgi:hypothetical protein
MTMLGIVSHCEGLIFNAGAAGATIALIIFTGNWSLKNCHVFANSTIATTTIRATGASTTRTLWDNVTIQFGAIQQSIALQGGEFTWRNTPTAIVGTAPTNLFGAGCIGSAYLRGVDISGLGSSKNLAGIMSSGFVPISLVGCKEPASWTSTNRFGAQTADLLMVTAERSENTALNYTKYKEEITGTQTIDTGIVRTGGATDGTTPTSWKIDTATRAKAKPQRPFRSTPIVIWNDVTGTNRVVTVYGVASALPNNNDIWLEIEYAGSSSSPMLTIDTQTTIATPLTTAVPVATDSSTWGGALTGKFKLVATLSTPQPAMKGPMTIRVCVGGQSTYYIDWQPVLS